MSIRVEFQDAARAITRWLRHAVEAGKRILLRIEDASPLDEIWGQGLAHK